jgi:hypothetical protein
MALAIVCSLTFSLSYPQTLDTGRSVVHDQYPFTSPPTPWHLDLSILGWSQRSVSTCHHSLPFGFHLFLFLYMGLPKPYDSILVGTPGGGRTKQA